MDAKTRGFRALLGLERCYRKRTKNDKDLQEFLEFLRNYFPYEYPEILVEIGRFYQLHTLPPPNDNLAFKYYKHGSELHNHHCLVCLTDSSQTGFNLPHFLSEK
jgi:hypothetical protein